MDIELTSEQRMLADSAQAFVSEELLPLEVEVERNGEVSPEQGERIKHKAIEMGFMQPTCPNPLEAAASTTPASRSWNANLARSPTPCTGLRGAQLNS